MPDKPQAETPAPAPQPAENAGKKKGNMMLGGIIAAVMVVEGVGLYAGMKMFGAGPQSAESHEGAAPAVEQPAELIEVLVAKLKAPNRASGRTFIYDVEIAARVRVPEGKASGKGGGHGAGKGDGGLEEIKNEISKKFEERKNAIHDRLNWLIRSAEPQHLEEPGLVVMRRQIKAELDKILGDDKLIESILIPRWASMRSDM